VPLDYALATSHVRTKAASSPGTFANDPDVADPGVELPALATGDPTTALAWRLPGRETGRVKLKVTFRDADGLEVAGTYKAYGFVVVPLSEAEKGLGATRPSIELHPGVEDGSSAEPLIFDDIGAYDIFGLRLYDVVAANATHAFIRVEEVL
jgi:hypothetical protein